MKHYSFLTILIISSLFLTQCEHDAEDSEAQLVFKFKFDPTQERLNNLGQPADVPPGNAGQSPRFNGMSAHYVELSPNNITPVGGGEILYLSPETNEGGANAIDFDEEVIVGDEETFLTLNLKNVTAGTYQYLRISLAYQNYEIDLMSAGFSLSGTVASFVGDNTYIRDYVIKDSSVTVNSNKLQGYWGFEVNDPPVPIPIITGQAPQTTVPNPIFNTSPIPPGSCLVTGEFDPPLVIDGTETASITITASVSTNKSFEWQDGDGNGKWDPDKGESVVDMGVRGLIPIVSQP